jgi:hypothetical protein
MYFSFVRLPPLDILLHPIVAVFFLFFEGGGSSVQPSTFGRAPSKLGDAQQYRQQKKLKEKREK